MWNSFKRKPEFIEFYKDSSWMLNENLTPNKKNIEKCKVFHDLKNVKQSRKWHKEGNAWKHTFLVCEHMLNILNNQGNHLGDRDRKILMLAALCHDLGKVPTTYWDENEKDWKCKNHGASGEKITRNLLFAEPDKWLREEVCWLVRWHMEFHHFLDKPEDKQTSTLQRLGKGNSSIEKLLLLNIADSLGSKSKDYSERAIWGKFDIIKAIAEAHHCYNQPYVERKKKIDNYTMFVMIGVPGSGKDTYINSYLKNIDVICRDDIREEMTDGKILGRKLYFDNAKEAMVTNNVNLRIKQCCMEHKSFILNQTNMKKKYRDSLKEEAFKYGNPKVVYIYIEPPTIELCKERRGHGKWDAIIDRMWGDFEFPDRSECDELIFFQQ